MDPEDVIPSLQWTPKSSDALAKLSDSLKASAEKMKKVAETLQATKLTLPPGTTFGSIADDGPTYFPPEGLSMTVELDGVDPELLALLAGPDFNPLDHPRDHQGKFIKKHTGTFLWGKVKQATFTGAGSKKVTLQPGDSLVKVTTPDNTTVHVIHSKATGYVHSIKDGQMGYQHKPTTNVSKAVKPNIITPKGWTSEVLTTAPAVEVDATQLGDAKTKINKYEGKTIFSKKGWVHPIVLEDTQELFEMPDGSYIVVTDSVPDDYYTSDGTWNDLVPDEIAVKVASQGKLVATWQGPAEATPTKPTPPFITAKNTFTHPVSKKTFNVMEVRQHKVSKNSFIVRTTDGSYLFVSALGKSQKASDKQLAADTFDVVYLNFELLQAHTNAKTATMAEAYGAGPAKIKEVQAQAAEATAQWEALKQSKAAPKGVAYKGTVQETFSSGHQATTYVANKYAQLEEMFGSFKAYSSTYKFGAKTDSPLHPSKHKTVVLAALSNPEMLQLASDAVATLEQVKTKKWNSSLKQALGKDRARFGLLLEIGHLAQDLQNPDADPKKINDRWDIISAKLYKANQAFGEMPLPAKAVKDHLTKEVKSWHFKKNLEGLGFDPDTADHMTLANYANANGFPAGSVLSQEELKQWALAHLVDPSLINPTAVEKGLVDKAKAKVALTNALMSQHSNAPTADMAQHTKAVAKQQEAIAKQIQSMAFKYEGPGQKTLVYAGEDSWQTETGSVITTKQALQLITKPGWTSSAGLVSGDLQFEGKKIAFLVTNGDPATMPAAELNAALKELGADYVGKMSLQEKTQWLNYHFAGDNFAKFHLEASAASKSLGKVTPAAHLKHNKHPGSPFSPKGEASLQALSDYLHGLEGWKGAGDIKSLPDASLDEMWATLNLDNFAMAYGFSNPSPTKTNKLTVVQAYLKSKPLPKPSYKPEALKVPSGKDPAPAGIDEAAWAVVLDAEKPNPTQATKDLLTGDVPSSKPYAFVLNDPTVWGFIPDETKKLIAWATSAPSSEEKDKIQSALQARANSGAYIPKNAVQAQTTFGTLTIPPGAKLYKYDASGTQMKLVYADGTHAVASTSGVMQTHNLSLDGYTLVLSAPKLATFEKYQAAGLPGSSDVWKMVEKAEALKGIDTDTQAQAAHAIKNLPVDSPYSSQLIHDNFDSLPPGVKKLLAISHKNSSPFPATMVDYKLSTGHYSSLTAAQVLDTSKPYSAKVAQGHTTAEAVSLHWTHQEQQAFLNDFGMTAHSSQLNAEAIADKLQQAFDPDYSPPAPTKEFAPKELKLTKLAKHLGGMHSKQAWTDQTGNEWMSKTFPSDPNSAARVDAEDAANKIAVLFGSRAPETRTMDLDGNYSYVQALKPASGSLQGMGPEDLNQEQLAQAMEEHVVDWLISNHDSHPENLLRDPNGKDIIPIDKGQAWRFFGEAHEAKGLVVGYHATNPIPTWYDRYYDALQKGKIDQATADAVAKRVMQKALKVSTKHDAEFASLLDHAFKNRTNWPGAYPNKTAFTKAVMERKAKALADFETFYKDLHKKGGLAWNVDTSKLQAAKLDDHTHLTVSPDFAADVKKAKTHGKAILFNSKDVEDIHMLFYTEMGQNHKEQLRGEMKLRETAANNLVAWLATQSVQSDVGHSTHSMTPADTAAVLPKNDEWWSAILAGVKTVNHHASDGEYNAATLAQMDKVKDEIDTALQKLAAHEKKSPGKPYTGPPAGSLIKTKEQQDAWKAAMEKYITDIDTIYAVKGQQGKVSPPLTQAYYQPSPGLDKTTFNGAAPEVEDAPDVASQVLVGIAGKDVKVTKKKAHGTGGSFNPDTGYLTQAGKEESGYPGYQYDIEYGNVRISFRPQSEPGTPAAQANMLRVEITDWSGDHTDIDDVLQVIESMGVDLTPADEQGLELFYWRHLAGILKDRKDGKSKYKPILDHLKATVDDDTPQETELAEHRAAWAKVIGEDKVKNADWRPKFQMFSPLEGGEATQGHPYWMNPEYSLAEYKAMSKGRPPSSSVGNPNQLYNLAMSGYLPSEERLRILASWYAQGGYNSQTQDQANGASGFVFTRQNKGWSFGAVHYHPRVALRTHNYAFPGDYFGDTKKRAADAPFDLKASSSTSHASPSANNELMVKYGVGMSDIGAIVFASTTMRAKILARYHELGIDTINGIPIEEVFVTSAAAAEKTIAKLWKEITS